MAVVVINEIPQRDQDFYEQVSAHVIPGFRLPDGCQVHIAGPSSEGWRVITVWDSEEAFHQFRSEKLIPAMREVAGEDFSPPSVQLEPVHKLLVFSA